MTTEARVRTVGVDLQESDETHFLVEAIEADNPDLTITHMPGLVRVTSPTTLTINAATVTERLGRTWETHEFQLSIVSFYGHIAEWDDDSILIAWDH